MTIVPLPVRIEPCWVFVCLACSERSWVPMDGVPDVVQCGHCAQKWRTTVEGRCHDAGDAHPGSRACQ